MASWGAVIIVLMPLLDVAAAGQWPMRRSFQSPCQKKLQALNELNAPSVFKSLGWFCGLSPDEPDMTLDTEESLAWLEVWCAENAWDKDKTKRGTKPGIGLTSWVFKMLTYSQYESKQYWLANCDVLRECKQEAEERHVEIAKWIVALCLGTQLSFILWLVVQRYAATLHALMRSDRNSVKLPHSGSKDQRGRTGYSGGHGSKDLQRRHKGGGNRKQHDKQTVEGKDNTEKQGKAGDEAGDDGPLKRLLRKKIAARRDKKEQEKKATDDTHSQDEAGDDGPLKRLLKKKIAARRDQKEKQEKSATDSHSQGETSGKAHLKHLIKKQIDTQRDARRRGSQDKRRTSNAGNRRKSNGTEGDGGSSSRRESANDKTRRSSQGKEGGNNDSNDKGGRKLSNGSTKTPFAGSPHSSLLDATTRKPSSGAENSTLDRAQLEAKLASLQNDSNQTVTPEEDEKMMELRRVLHRISTVSEGDLEPLVNETSDDNKSLEMNMPFQVPGLRRTSFSAGKIRITSSDTSKSPTPAIAVSPTQNGNEGSVLSDTSEAIPSVSQQDVKSSPTPDNGAIPQSGKKGSLSQRGSLADQRKQSLGQKSGQGQQGTQPKISSQHDATGQDSQQGEQSSIEQDSQQRRSSRQNSTAKQDSQQRRISQHSGTKQDSQGRRTSQNSATKQDSQQRRTSEQRSAEQDSQQTAQSPNSSPRILSQHSAKRKDSQHSNVSQNSSSRVQDSDQTSSSQRSSQRSSPRQQDSEQTPPSQRSSPRQQDSGRKPPSQGSSPRQQDSGQKPPSQGSSPRQQDSGRKRSSQQRPQRQDTQLSPSKQKPQRQDSQKTPSKHKPHREDSQNTPSKHKPQRQNSHKAPSKHRPQRQDTQKAQDRSNDSKFDGQTRGRKPSRSGGIERRSSSVGAVKPTPSSHSGYVTGTSVSGASTVQGKGGMLMFDIGKFPSLVLDKSNSMSMRLDSGRMPSVIIQKGVDSSSSIDLANVAGMSPVQSHCGTSKVSIAKGSQHIVPSFTSNTPSRHKGSTDTLKFNVHDGGSPSTLADNTPPKVSEMESEMFSPLRDKEDALGPDRREGRQSDPSAARMQPPGPKSQSSNQPVHPVPSNNSHAKPPRSPSSRTPPGK